MKNVEIGSAFEAVELNSESIKNFTMSKVSYFLRSAREALFLIGKNHLNDFGNKVVFIPSLCCASMVQPFKQLDYEIIFYSIKNNFTVKEADLLKKIRPASLVLLVEYYGMPSCSNEFLDELKFNHSCKIIKDYTQSFLDFFKDDDRSDYKVLSVRKWFPIPDGAFLCVKQNIDCNITSDDSYATKYYSGMEMKRQYLCSNELALKRKYLDVFKNCNLFLKQGVVPTKASLITCKIFPYLDITMMMNVRKRNYQFLFNELHDGCNRKIKTVYFEQEGPFCLPILVNENRDDLQKYLSDNGVYCQVLWPLPNERINDEFSEWFSNHMLAIPCDQRYELEDMSRIASLLKKYYQENDK